MDVLECSCRRLLNNNNPVCHTQQWHRGVTFENLLERAVLRGHAKVLGVAGIAGVA